MSRILPRVAGLQQDWQQLLGSWPSLAALNDRRSVPAELPTSPSACVEPLPLRDALELSGVTFAYPERRPVFEDFSLTVPANRITALAGPSGAGKTTLADLALGLLRPQRGGLKIDGTPVSEENLTNWRRATAYLPQDNVLFSDTIRANLLWIAPDAKDELIWEALEQASAADFVQQLPDGLDTIVGERGAQISGGERQRIALARALLAKPSLLVLDEPTSALDEENETAIRNALIQLKPRLTILIITHRGGMLDIADNVVNLP